MKIIFWDIDGTLLTTARAGLHAFKQATVEVFGLNPSLKGITAAGMTDKYIASQIIFKAVGTQGSEQEITALIKRYEELLPAHLAENDGFTIPPVSEILTYLSEKPDYLSLLLTGNTATGARAKLRRYNLDHFFDFSLSAFGNDSWNRSGVAAQALASVQARYPSVRPHQLFVIGDTPSDISCGKEIGAWTIAVATGAYTLEELEPHSPWWLVKSLPKPDRFAEKIESANK